MLVPEFVRRRATALGADGVQWLAELPEVIASLERRWGITVGPPLPGASTAAVLRARTRQGRDAVLKIEIPDPDLRPAGQLETLAAARGNGYVVLLEHDREHRALLLEALGTSLDRSGLPAERQLHVLGGLLLRCWQLPLPAGVTLEQAQDKAVTLSELVTRLWHELGRPCPERVVARALEYADRRRRDTRSETAVVVHGDPHPANALRVLSPRAGAEASYVFVDPDGFVADPAYDAGVVVRGWCSELLAAEDPRATAAAYCRLVADRCRLDPAAVGEWGFLERVSTGLYILQFGAADLAAPYLETAELLV